MYSHAANPVADHVEGDLFKIYFSTRNVKNESSIGWILLDINDPLNILEIASEPVLSPGKIGTFSDSGCSIGSIVNVHDKKYLYYMGWNLGVTVPWRNAIGLAISDDNGKTFHNYSEAPIIDRSQEDPYTVSYPWVIYENQKWHMWYGSNLEWGSDKADMHHMIKYASSNNGINWVRDGKVTISPQLPQEYAFAKPCVIKEDSKYRMWYAYRGEKYKIGLAFSNDGTSWTRCDDAVGILPSAEGWDSESIEYPYVFKHKEKLYMLYNGNDYGKTGFGIAILES